MSYFNLFYNECELILSSLKLFKLTNIKCKFLKLKLINKIFSSWDEDFLDARKRMTKLNYVRKPNSIAKTCKMTKFVSTVNLNQLSLT